MRQRQRFSPQKKVIILREHIENQVPLSELSERYGIHVNLLYRWKKKLFEGALETFSQKHVQRNQAQSHKISRLEARMSDKDRLISELVEENIALKKSLNGEI